MKAAYYWFEIKKQDANGTIDALPNRESTLKDAFAVLRAARSRKGAKKFGWFVSLHRAYDGQPSVILADYHEEDPNLELNADDISGWVPYPFIGPVFNEDLPKIASLLGDTCYEAKQVGNNHWIRRVT